MVMRITLVGLPFVQSAFAVAAEPLWLRSVLAGSVGAVAETVVTGLFKLWDRGGNAKLDRTNPEVEIEAQRGPRGDDRPRDCARLM